MKAPIITMVGKGKFRLVQEWRYKGFSVPEGFETDLASIPAILSPLFPKTGLNLPAAILHDYFYASACVSRSYADKAFLITMKDFEVPWWRAYLMYAAVRAFGWAFYNKNPAGND